MHYLVMLVALVADVGYAQKFDYRVLATTKTSTMEKEMNEAAAGGFVFGGVMGGETGAGGKEMVVIMGRDVAAPGRRSYKLLATSRTGTMQKELQQAGDEGFHYRGQTVYQSGFGGHEVVIILEKNSESAKRVEYKLLSTTRTGTMQKELREAGDNGYRFLGVMVGKTAMGGKEVISLLEKVPAP
ncbi:MAG: hypothetical protein HY820_41250 [Acidobacteria bacterium]|nr:hypothetical protein [Acidobacteriota bacterium]